jgi:RHS repeat-associated protein
MPYLSTLSELRSTLPQRESESLHFAKPCDGILPPKKSQKPASDPLLDSFTIMVMNIHPITTPTSPSLASPLFDASFDSIESLTTYFTASAAPTIETTTVTEVALGYHRNQQYSITAMTTSTGAVAERYAYTANGQPTIASASGSVLTSSAVGNRYTYTGREWDETLGLHHFRARWMSPMTGRFLGRDPIGYAGSEWGLYEFLDGMPLGKCDPSGLVPILCICHEYPPFSGGLGPGRPREYTVSTNCRGLGENCCREACRPYGFSGNWKIVEGRDAYDDASEDLDDAVCNIQFCCMPLPVAGIVSATSRTC